MTSVSESMLAEPAGLELRTGDCMTRKEFHRVYSQMPADFQAELIGGIVYVASPLKLWHGANHLPLGTLLFNRLQQPVDRSTASVRATRVTECASTWCRASANSDCVGSTCERIASWNLGRHRVRLGGFWPLGWLDLAFVVLEVIFFATSRDT